jgi:hypothetical protein
MKKRLIVLLSIVSILLLAGCIDTTLMIAVRKDGSGLIMETVYVDPDIESMMKQMASDLGEVKNVEVEASESEERPIDMAKYRLKAAKMGEGVQLLSAKRIRSPDGSPGERIVYTFEDIRRLRIDSSPEDLSPTGSIDRPVQETGSDEGKPLLFDFVPGDPARLIVQMPRKDRNEHQSTEEKPSASVNPSGDFGQLAQMFKGFRFRVVVKVLDGEIIQTNAIHVSEGVESARKQLVTLFDFDFGEMLNHKDAFEKLEHLNEIDDITVAMEMLDGIPGIRFDPASRIRIDFR